MIGRFRRGRPKTVILEAAAEESVPLWDGFFASLTCQTIEDVPYLLKYGTADHLMIGSDFTHADQSADIDSLPTVKRWGEDGSLPPEVAHKVLEDNPAAFYGL